MENFRAGRLRDALRRSYAAIAVIVLLYLWAISPLIAAWVDAWHELGPYVLTAIAIRGAPTIGPWEGSALQRSLSLAGIGLVGGGVNLALAWLVAHWVYGTGPLQALSAGSKPLRRRDHV